MQNNIFGFVSGLALTLMALFPHQAMASRFICTSVDQITQIEVLFGDPKDEETGPRALRMSFKDLTVSEERQMIASFSFERGVLDNQASRIRAVVDLANPESSRRGERIGGTVLGALESIDLDIDISYREPVSNGLRFSGQATFRKKRGTELVEDFDCVHLLDIQGNFPFSNDGIIW